MKDRIAVQTSLLAIAKKAKRDKRYRFRNLYRELNEELLRDSWRLLRKDAALGVDRVSAAEYETNLEENIQFALKRLKEEVPDDAQRALILGGNLRRELGLA